MMDQALLQHARDVWKEFSARCAERRQRRLEAMIGYFTDFMDDLLNYPLVRPWRQSLDLFQEHYWHQAGMRLMPDSYQQVAALIEEAVNDPSCYAYGPIQPDATGLPPGQRLEDVLAEAKASQAASSGPRGPIATTAAPAVLGMPESAIVSAATAEDRKHLRDFARQAAYLEQQRIGMSDEELPRCEYFIYDNLLRRARGETPRTLQEYWTHKNHALDNALALGQGQPPSAAATKPTKSAPQWPALSEEDRQRNRKGVGIRWWWPIQPTNAFDADWERVFEQIGRQARDQLLVVFQELARTGKLAKDLEAKEDVDLQPLEEQSAKAQTAFDAYLVLVLRFRRKWVAYQYEGSSVGIHVFALVERIDNALPTRVDGLRSHYDRELADVAQQSTKAGRLALSRAEGAYREIRFVDWAVTAVEIISVIGGIRATATKVAVKAIAEGATESAARNLAIKYAVKQLVVQSAVAAGAQTVIPPILSSAGLNEDEIRAGLAILQALQTLAALKTLKVGSGASKETPDRPPRSTTGPPPDSVSETGSQPRFLPPIEGTLDRPRSIKHRFLQRTLAEDMQASGKYVRVAMRMSLRKFSGVKDAPNIFPDNMGLTTEGQIDMFEIVSGKQTKRELSQRLENAMSRLPEKMRGGISVIDPKEAVQ